MPYSQASPATQADNDSGKDNCQVEVRVIVVPAHKRFLEAVKPFALDIRTVGSDWEIVPRCQADQETILRHLRLSGIHGVLRRVRPEVVIG